ncbi:MAG: cytochrome b/b6 domain-containing protein [Pseudomonadota bacterium]
MFTVLVWDLPTRLFHWTLAACMVGLVITGNVGGDAMAWHFRLGYTLLALLLFRLAWGFCGGYWSRWAQLPLHPANVWAYLQGRSQAKHRVGHNPLGSWSVVAMLIFLALQVATGLVSDDEITNLGPLSSLMPGVVVSWATSWHKGWGKLILIGLVMTHLVALAWYRWRRHQSLVPAMWHGNKVLPDDTPASHDDLGSRGLAFVLLVLAGCAVAALVSLGD